MLELYLYDIFNVGVGFFCACTKRESEEYFCFGFFFFFFAFRMDIRTGYFQLHGSVILWLFLVKSSFSINILLCWCTALI